MLKNGNKSLLKPTQNGAEKGLKKGGGVCERQRQDERNGSAELKNKH